jgi:hypothetical protein
MSEAPASRKKHENREKLLLVIKELKKLSI